MSLARVESWILPKFAVPFRVESDSSLFVPKTRIELGVSVLHRLLYYQLFSVDASFGYDWKESINTEENFSPLSMTYAHLTNRTQAFDDLLSSNPFLRNSFEEQFVIGQNYSFTYNDQLEKDRTNHMYFKGSIDISGNLLGLAQSLFIKHKATPETPYEIFGTTYSQYYKFDIDVRKYYNSNDQSSSFANRLIVGVGFPYGNSVSLPYVSSFILEEAIACVLSPQGVWAPDRTKFLIVSLQIHLLTRLATSSLRRIASTGFPSSAFSRGPVCRCRQYLADAGRLEPARKPVFYQNISRSSSGRNGFRPAALTSLSSSSGLTSHCRCASPLSP